MKHFATSILFLLVTHSLLAQNQGHIWYFGDHAGLDFNSGNPVFTSGGQTYFPDGTHNEGTAIMSDSAGSLLFYCNGEKIWDKNHMIMPNGDSLMGHYSSTQAALILPQPGSSRYFYVFTTDGFFLSNMDKGLRYSIVDMCMNSGTGDVMPNQKNILLLDTVAEKLTAVRHSNGTDYWVITHKFYSDAFYAFQLSANGIVDTVISHIGSVHPTGSQSTGAAIGQLKASPDGSKLAIANGNSSNSIAEYFDFDPLTGIVSNVVDVQLNINYHYYGVSFSPDNSKLYFACWLNGNGLYQFDLTAGAGDPDSVRASRTIVSSTYNYQALQLGPDGKIYVTRMPIANTFLGVINNPNSAGMACNFIDNSLSLNGQSSSYGLPNFMDSYDYSNTIPGCITGIAEQTDEDHAAAFPNPFVDQTTITFGKRVDNGTIILRNALGQTVTQYRNVSGESFVVQRGELSPGFYVVQLLEEDSVVFSETLIIAKAE